MSITQICLRPAAALAILLLSSAAVQAEEVPPPQKLPSFSEFKVLARSDERTFRLGLSEVKFVITDLDTEQPKIHYIDGSRYPIHTLFVRDVLRIGDYMNYSWPGSTPRRYFGGALVHWPNANTPDGKSGVVALEGLARESADVALLAKVFATVRTSVGDFKDRLAWHPILGTGHKLAPGLAEQFKKAGVPLVFDANLFARLNFQAMNIGQAFGFLRKDEGKATSMAYTDRDIVIFPSLPMDVGRLAGAITEAPQTPLCHINLRARQNKMPNAYRKDASKDPGIAGLVGKLVKLEVTEQGLTVIPATEAEAEVFFAARKPAQPQSVKSDFSVRELRAIADLRFGDSAASGAKAANLGELAAAIPGHAPALGFAVPFSWFHEFMAKNGLQEEAKSLAASLSEKRNSLENAEKLKGFRKKIRKANAPAWMEETLEKARAQFPTGTSLRCRSSTNNEDLVGFSGAGLYESYTHRADEGNLMESVKQVWASMWTLRAWDERDYHGVDHLSASMAVLVHPNFDDEMVNGVAVAKNLFIPGAGGFTVNAQIGEDLVTNPEKDSLPEEWLVAPLPTAARWTTTRLRQSNRVAATAGVVPPERVAELADQLKVLQAHFQKLYKSPSPEFAIEVEFKITKEGALIIKQARPWVD